MRFNYLPTLRAKIELGNGNPSKAIETLQVTAPYELGQSTSNSCNWTALLPVYVRGEAYLAAHRGRDAAAEFQKIIVNRGAVLNEPIGALARLGLARSYVLSGEISQARRGYEDYFEMWKDADPDVPILTKARKEYSELR